jgi:hypothetical protein
MSHRSGLQEKKSKLKRESDDFHKIKAKDINKLQGNQANWVLHKKSFLPSKTEIIELNIGGTHKITTSRSTLTKVSILLFLFLLVSEFCTWSFV